MSNPQQQAHAALQARLQPGEEMIWSGSPHQGIAPDKRTEQMILFASLGYTVVVFLLIVVLPALGWALGLISLPVYVFLRGKLGDDALRRKHTAYALTDQRVIIVAGENSDQIVLLDLYTLPEIHLAEEQDGTGTITFGAIADDKRTPAFEALDNVRTVYDQILGAQQALE